MKLKMSERKHQRAAAQAIRRLLHEVRWKPNKDEQHLAKRKAMGHLSKNVTMNDYNVLISTILHEANNLVYHYPFDVQDYYAVSGEVTDRAWLVIFGMDGIMETAFPPDDIADYLTKHGFVMLGRMEEILHE